MKNNIKTSQNQIAVIPKYYQLKEILLQDIRKGKYTSNSKLPSESELMDKYNVSYTTVRRTKLELMNENILYSIQGKGCYIAEPKRTRDEKVIEESKRIMFMLPGVSKDYLSDLLEGMLQIFQPKGYNLEISAPRGDYQKELKLLGTCLKEKIAGILFYPTFHFYPHSSHGSYRPLIQLQNKGIPVVLMFNKIKDFKANYIGINDFKSACNAMNYLIKTGHKKILFVGGVYPALLPIKKRLDGYEYTLKKNKIKIDPRFILTDCRENTPTSEMDGYVRMKKFLNQKLSFDAIFAKDDLVAIGAHKALKEAGIKVPDEVSIIGFNDTTVAKHYEVPLTTVKHDVYHIGYHAAKMILSRMNGKSRQTADYYEHKIIRTKLIIRDSVKNRKKVNK